jgi:hypothetical protein
MPSNTPGEGIPSAAQTQAKRAAAVKAATDAANTHKAHLEAAAYGKIHQEIDAWQPEKANDPLKGSKPATPVMGMAPTNIIESKVGPAYDASGISHPSMGGLVTGLSESNQMLFGKNPVNPGMGSN